MIRAERPADAGIIPAITTAAFERVQHSDQREAAIVEALRAAKALSLSLVAEEDGELVGHIAFSAVTIDGRRGGWFGLGPVSVLPERQGLGIGSALIRGGLEQLRVGGAQGCVVLGDPHYYGRFGFLSDPALRFPGVPAEYFQRLIFAGGAPAGEVAYDPAFGAGSSA